MVTRAEDKQLTQADSSASLPVACQSEVTNDVRLRTAECLSGRSMHGERSNENQNGHQQHTHLRQSRSCCPLRQSRFPGRPPSPPPLLLSIQQMPPPWLSQCIQPRVQKPAPAVPKLLRAGVEAECYHPRPLAAFQRPELPPALRTGARTAFGQRERPLTPEQDHHHHQRCRRRHKPHHPGCCRRRAPLPSRSQDRSSGPGWSPPRQSGRGLLRPTVLLAARA